MSKRHKFFDKIAEYKERFRKLSTEQIRTRVLTAPLMKEASIAYREVLEERGDSLGAETASAAFTIPEDRTLSGDEEGLVRWLLSNADARGRSFLPQLDAARVVSRCSCGCASVDFSINAIVPAPGARLEQISNDYYWNLPNGGLCGVFVFAKENRLAGLEVWSVDGEETPVSLPNPEQLRAEP